MLLLHLHSFLLRLSTSTMTFMLQLLKIYFFMNYSQKYTMHLMTQNEIKRSAYTPWKHPQKMRKITESFLMLLSMTTKTKLYLTLEQLIPAFEKTLQ